MMKIILINILLLISINAFAQSYSIGSSVDDFTLLNVDDKQISLFGNTEVKGVIVVFTCNHCPYAKLYEDRIIELDKKYKEQGYPVIAINPNDPLKEPEDSFENMKKVAKEKSYTFPYLVDKTQEVAKKFGATRTPHVCLLQNENNKYILKYVGAIDNNPQNAKDVSKRYLEDAVNALQNGKKIEKTSAKSIGCTIKWK